MGEVEKYACWEDAVNKDGEFFDAVRHTDYAALLASHKELVEALKALDSHIDFSEDTPDNSAWTFDKGDGINQACAQAKAALERASQLTGQ